eukprot:11480580-Karenia_brevis.AAC.1
MIAESERRLGLSYGTLMRHAEGNPFCALAVYKSIIRRVAAETRNFLLRHGCDKFSEESILTTVSRAVSQQNVSLAKFLTRIYPLARTHIRFNSASSSRPLSFVDAPQFSRIMSQSRHSVLASRIADQECFAQNPRLPKAKVAAAKYRLSCLSRIIAQWTPTAKFLCLSAILDDHDEVIASEPNAVVRALASYWKPVFDGSQTSFDAGLAQDVCLETLGEGWDWSRLRTPNEFDFQRILRGSEDSGPGKD